MTAGTIRCPPCHHRSERAQWWYPRTRGSRDSRSGENACRPEVFPFSCHSVPLGGEPQRRTEIVRRLRRRLFFSFLFLTVTNHTSRPVYHPPRRQPGNCQSEPGMFTAKVAEGVAQIRNGTKRPRQCPAYTRGRSGRSTSLGVEALPLGPAIRPRRDLGLISGDRFSIPTPDVYPHFRSGPDLARLDARGPGEGRSPPRPLDKQTCAPGDIEALGTT